MTTHGCSLREDISKIHSILFDHRPLLQEEVKSFVQDFEGKKEDREVHNLFKIFETVTELKDQDVGKVKSLCDSNFPKLLSEIQVADSIAEKLVDQRSASEERLKLKLQQNQKSRSSEWNDIVNDLAEKCKQIDIEYERREAEVTKLYEDMEKKLLPVNLAKDV